MNGNVGAFERFEIVETFAEYLERIRPVVEKSVPPLSRAHLRRLYDEDQRMVHYRSADYHVAIDKTPPHGFAGAIVWHLSIKRHDRAPIMDWRDMQAIKSALCGAEAEALQLFPAESRVVDTANQYHLFAFMKMDGRRLPHIPVGWTSGIRVDEPGGAAVNRPGASASTWLPRLAVLSHCAFTAMATFDRPLTDDDAARLERHVRTLEAQS